MEKEKNSVGLSRDYIIHPGETLAEVLEDREMTQRELAVRTGMTEKHISTIVHGQKGISVAFARKLEYALGIEAVFWMNLQTNYDWEILEFEELNNITEQELGALRNSEDGSLILCMTLMQKFAGIFWFTLFHEIAHILNGDTKQNVWRAGCKCMAIRGKNIQLFLMDGEATGRMKCTLANWTGIAYKIPRTELDKCKERDDLKQSGVYFLFGTSDETGKGLVYIGQAGARKNGEGILNRLQEHKRNPDKDYWTEAIVFTTSNNSFGPTEISYLENRFCNMAIEANRYDVKNSNDPTPGNITEEKESEMEEFIDYAKVIMGTLGHKLFEPISKPVLKKRDDMPINTENTIKLRLERTIKNVGKVEASGYQTPEGFVVLQGSHISKVDDNTIPATIKERRKNAVADALVNADGVLQEDMLFTSPSYAAMFVIGKSENGLTRWKTEDGRTLKSLEESNDA